MKFTMYSFLLKLLVMSKPKTDNWEIKFMLITVSMLPSVLNYRSNYITQTVSCGLVEENEQYYLLDKLLL